jgi:hypothetical protein
MDSTTMDNNAIFAQLMDSTNRELVQLKADDGWETICMKQCRKKKIDGPSSISSFNPLCVSCCTYYPLMIAKERLQAVTNIFAWLRGQNFPPHLVEETCSLVLTISNVITISETSPVVRAQADSVAATGDIPAVPAVKELKFLSPKLAFEVLEPMLSVIESKLIYMKTKASGLSATSTTALRLQMNAVAPEDKKIANATSIGKEHGSFRGQNNNNRNNNNNNTRFNNRNKNNYRRDDRDHDEKRWRKRSRSP